MQTKYKKKMPVTANRNTYWIYYLHKVGKWKKQYAHKGI